MGISSNDEAVGTKEGKLQIKRGEKEIKSTKDINIGKKDFILEHKGSFTDKYKVGAEIGRGIIVFLIYSL